MSDSDQIHNKHNHNIGPIKKSTKASTLPPSKYVKILNNYIHTVDMTISSSAGLGDFSSVMGAEPLRIPLFSFLLVGVRTPLSGLCSIICRVLMR